MEKKYSIAELAILTGVTRRGVRFYVQKGLIPPPLGGGRGRYYTEDHRQKLSRIKELQGEKFSLSQISEILRGKISDDPTCQEASPWAAPDLWARITLKPGIELHIQTGLYKLTPARLSNLGEAIHKALESIIPNSAKGEE